MTRGTILICLKHGAAVKARLHRQIHRDSRIVDPPMLCDPFTEHDQAF